MTYHIYCITNKINNKSYIGQSIDAISRWKDHISDAKRKFGKTANNKKFAIHNAINKYGKENFIWQIIETVDTIDESNEAEEFYISYWNTIAPNGYNLKYGGKNHKLSEETKIKISNTLKRIGTILSNKGVDHPNFGNKLSNERKEYLSKKFSGDNGANKKITAEIAKEIYLKYLNDMSQTCYSLKIEYGLKSDSTISNILTKKSWKEVLKDLPAINTSKR